MIVCVSDDHSARANVNHEARSNNGDSLPARIARDIIIGMARPINQHLIKLVSFDFPPQLRDHLDKN
jgi:hypothetical protein